MIRNYTFEIEGENERECSETAKALNTIYKKIKSSDLIWVAAKIEEDPNVINKVIKIANNPLVKKMF